MRPLFMVTGIMVITLVAGCRSTPLPAVVPSTSEQTATGSIHDFSNEVTPKTPESLEVAPLIETVPVTVSASGTIIVGSPTAPTLRVVTDPSCPYCQDFVLGDQLWMEKTYVAPGKLALELVYRPMDAIGILNAKALLCSLKDDSFVEMERSIAVKRLESETDAIARAKTLHIPSKTFTACLRSKETAVALQTHEQIADAMQVTRVPSFALGTERWMGLESRATLQGMIERAL